MAVGLDRKIQLECKKGESDMIFFTTKKINSSMFCKFPSKTKKILPLPSKIPKDCTYDRSAYLRHLNSTSEEVT